MRKLYVTELTTLDDGRSISEVIEKYGQDTWTLLRTVSHLTFGYVHQDYWLLALHLQKI